MSDNPILRIAASPELLQRGCVNLIGLEEIQAEIGPRWEKLKATVWAHLETLLSQKLGATDFYTRISETSFLVSMPAVRHEEAQIFCLRVAHDLHTSLLGSCDPTRLRISLATELNGDTVVSIPIVGEMLRILAARAGLDKSAGVPEHEEKTAPDRKPSPSFQHKFIPIWDAQREALTTYRCVTQFDQNAPEAAREKLELGATLSRINVAAQSLAKHLEAGDRFIMWLPISFYVLSAPAGRMEIAAICRSLSSTLRPYIVFEISDLPDGIPQSRLSGLVSSLRPFCRGVAAQFPPRMINYGACLGAGLTAIGIALSACIPAEISGEIAKLGLAAKRQHLMSFVLDAAHDEILHSARDHGINMLSSPIIGAPLSEPAPIRRLSLRDITERHLSQSAAA